MKKKGPYILFIILIGVLGFILGVQYGKRLSIANQVTEKINSVVKQLQLTPTPQQNGYKKLISKDCSIAFTYPDSMTIKTTDSKSMILSTKNPKHYLSLTCQGKALSEKPDKYATKSITLNDGTITAYTYTINQEGQPLKVLDFSISHPTKRNKIHIIVDETLYSLFANSVNYL